jgi:hypothetical protein
MYLALPRHLLLCLLSLALFGTGAARLARAEVSQPQRELIDAALARLVVEPATRARVFFLGFAGFGAERVFAEEIQFAAARVAEKFGSAQRSLLLINDRRGQSWPLATHENLRHALRGLARRMNLESDILFVALASHGAQNAMIEISNTDMPAVGLSAGTLNRMLDEAGIKLRVIVVSACFSGAFVEPLARDESIVLTASSHDRPSFGCSDDRDLTYFGEAFYRDALPAARSLREAFEAARASIRRRERDERVGHSRPQSHFGVVVETRLSESMQVLAAEPLQLR